MKLYTEEQVKEMLGKATIPSHFGGFLYNERQLLENATPIELPSDEEIEEESPYIPNDSKIDYLSHQEGFIKGAKWMKEQILNQNK
jgi:hypothetical protein